MSASKTIWSLKNQGSILFVHSCFRDIYCIYKDIEDNGKLYLLNLDKLGNIVDSSPIVSEIDYNTVSNVRWYRHRLDPDNGNKFIYSGHLKQENGNYFRFEVKDLTLTLGEEFILNETFKLGKLKSLEGVEVDIHTQKGNILFVCGLDTKYNEQVFLEICLRDDKAKRRYNLRSDEGDLTVRALAVDKDDRRVYIGGDIAKYDGGTDVLISTKLYFDSFSTRG